MTHPLSTYNRLAVDTAPFIYFIEEHPDYAELLRPLFQSADDGYVTLVTSPLTVTELLVKPFETSRQDLVDDYQKLLVHGSGLTCQPFTKDIAAKAAELRAAYGFRTPDAVHLATAFNSEAEAFLTNDKRLERYEDIEVVLVDELPSAEK